MRLQFLALPLFVLAGAPGSAPAAEPLACNLAALTPSERDRHQVLAEKLAKAVVGQAELVNGYELTLDLARLPADAQGSAFCVVEVAQWVDLEARCCPFLDFGIDVKGKGGVVKLRLTGGKNVKAFLEEELALLRPRNR